MDVFSWVIVGITLLFIAFLSIRKKMLDGFGILVGFIVSIFVAEKGGLGSFFGIVLFFLIGEAITRYARSTFHRKTHEIRSTANIIGNIGPALVALAFNPFSFNVGFFASLAAAFGDTLSSEIGSLSKEKPVLITTLSTVYPGEDGGVTILGFLASMLGGLLYGVLCYLITGDISWIGIMTLAGLLGSTLDSIIGATLQRGEYIDNNVTNFLAALLIGMLFAYLF